MAYVKNTWKDQDVERPKTYEVTNNQDGSITLTDSFGLVTELGTPVNAVNMNHIEDGLVDTDVTKYNATTTYNAGEWVTGVVDNEKSIYASKVDNNTGNALTNDTYWEKVEFGGDLSGKADVDLSNLSNGLANTLCTVAATTTSSASSATPAVVVQNYVNGTSWYRIYSDKWCEQGGYITGANADVTVSLMINYRDTNYSIVVAGIHHVGSNVVASCVTENSVQQNEFKAFVYVVGAYWRTAGYIN